MYVVAVPIALPPQLLHSASSSLGGSGGSGGIGHGATSTAQSSRCALAVEDMVVGIGQATALLGDKSRIGLLAEGFAQRPVKVELFAGSTTLVVVIGT